MKPADIRELDTTQLVITGLHEEIERMRRKMTAIQEIARAHHPGGLPATETKRVLDLAFFEDWERDNAARDMPPAFTGSVPDFEQHLRKLDDADLWRAKAVQLAAALEGATDRLAAACAETAATYETTNRAWLVDLMGEERLERGLAGHREVVEQLTAWRTLLTGDLAEPLAKLKRLREAVERELRFDPNAVIELIAAAREVVR